MPPAPKFFATANAFRRWFEANSSTAADLLVGFYKVDSGHPSMTWPESVDEALCFGWIDGVRKRIDDHSYTIRFTPRRPTSIWSAINIAKFEKLESERRTTPAGAAAFEHRKDHKSAIYSYEQPGVSELSTEEVHEFKRNKPAWRFFEETPPGYKKQMLHRITSAKKPQTRASRLAKLVQACEAGERLL